MSQPATTQLSEDQSLGRYYHAPQVRLLIGDGGQGTEPIVLPPTSDANGVSHPVHADIEHAEVSQVNQFYQIEFQTFLTGRTVVPHLRKRKYSHFVLWSRPQKILLKRCQI